MSNWGTRRKQKSVLPQTQDPAAELFLCTAYGCVITRTACGNRWQLANVREVRQAIQQPTEFNHCYGCAFGRAHAKGKEARGLAYLKRSKAPTPRAEVQLVPLLDLFKHKRHLRRCKGR